MWYTARHYRYPIHPQRRVMPHPPTMANDMDRIPVPVWITLAIIGGMITLALISFSLGWWEPQP